MLDQLMVIVPIFQLMELLNLKIKLNAEEDLANSVTRSVNRDTITVHVWNPNKPFLTGIKINVLEVQPGKKNILRSTSSQTWTRHYGIAAPNKLGPAYDKLTVEPDLEYVVSVVYTTDYGYLTPSDEVIPGKVIGISVRKKSII